MTATPKQPKPMGRFVVKRLDHTQRWEYLRPRGSWTSDVAKAQTWQYHVAADKASLKHPGAVVGIIVLKVIV